MQLNIQSHNIEVTDHLRRHTENRINDLFSNLNTRVLKVGVRYFKPNEKNIVICQMHIQARALPTIISEAQADSIYLAIEYAAQRAKRNVSRRFAKLEKLLNRIKGLKKQKIHATLLKLPNQNQLLTRELS